MTNDAVLCIGRISGCYGIKGWVKVRSFTDPPERFGSYQNCRLKTRAGQQAVVFDQCRSQGKGLIAHIVGVDDRNTAETLRGLDVVVNASELPALDEGDYYWHQLIGLAVWYVAEGGAKVRLGTVKQMLETGANDVLVVAPDEHSIDERERLIPYLVESVVKRVDVDSGVIEVDWPLDF